MARRDRKHLVDWSPSSSKHDWLNSPPVKPDWTKIEHWNDRIGWTPTRSKSDSTETGHWNYMIGPTPSPWKPDWVNSQPLETWLDETGIPKSADWLNSEPLEIWLAKLRAPRNLGDRVPRFQNRTYWTPSLKKSDWARPEYQTHLIERRCCILLSALLFDLRLLMFFWPSNLARRCFLTFRHWCFFDLWTLLTDVFSTFELCSSMFFRPLNFAHRCFFDLWTLLIDVFSTFGHWCFFYPCHRQTNNLILFHMTLPTVEGIYANYCQFYILFLSL
jgi:hypothetical protein